MKGDSREVGFENDLRQSGVPNRVDSTIVLQGGSILKYPFLIALALGAGLLQGALTEEQRVQDFQTVASAYAKSYGPANWKIQALGVNLFETTDWVKRVREAKNDLEHVQVLMEYVASFQDTHSRLSMPSNFTAQLGFFCDLYDGKVVVDLVTRSILPLSQYPIRDGDELVSIDGRPALEIARELMKTAGYGNPRAQLRIGVQRVTAVSQSVWPKAVDYPDESSVVIRHQGGEQVTYRIPWQKTGYPIRSLGVAPTPRSLSAGLKLSGELESPVVNPLDDEIPAWKRLHDSMVVMADSTSDNKLRGPVEEQADGRHLEPRAVLNYGSVFPYFTLPAGFRVRLGLTSGDVFFTGTYVADGVRIGYLRVGSFPSYTTAQLNALAGEIAFFNANTDGLVIDVTRNTGGSACSPSDLARTVVPGGFKEIGLAFRPTLALINSYDSAASQLRAQNAPTHIVQLYLFLRDLLLGSFNDSRSITGSLPACSLFGEQTSLAIAYSKPLITLTDDFSTSAGDLFPALMQDNKRGKIVGMRTNGAGGSVIDINGGWWSETRTRITQSLMIRLEEREFPGFPKSPFVENTGVRPDIELDYMTVENATSAGRAFVEQFTQILIREVNGNK